MFKQGAASHNALKNGFDMCLRTREYLTKEEWGEVCLLGAVIVHEYVMTMLDALKIALVESNVMDDEARHALSGIGGDVIQFNMTFSLILMKNKTIAGPLCEQLNQKLARDFSRETFDFFKLVCKVEGHATVLSSHLTQVALNTLVRFRLDKDFKMLAQRANKLQPPHMDNSTPGSYYQVILFGCHENGEPYYGEVPCTHVCKYDNMAESSMNGTGWPLNWRDLEPTTPVTVQGFASIVSPGNHPHWGVGRDTDSEYHVRLSLFRMARAPTCDQMFDDEAEGGDLQMFEWGYLSGLGLTDLMCESLMHPQNSIWRRLYTDKDLKAYDTIIRKWKKRTGWLLPMK